MLGLMYIVGQYDKVEVDNKSLVRDTKQFEKDSKLGTYMIVCYRFKYLAIDAYSSRF